MKHKWGGKEGESKKLEKDIHSFCRHTAKWPQLRAVAKNWTTGHRNNHISVPAELLILHGRRLVVACIIIDFSGVTDSCRIARELWGLSRRRISLLLLAVMKCLNSNNSNNECNSSDADFRGLYYQQNLHTALPLCWSVLESLPFKCALSSPTLINTPSKILVCLIIWKIWYIQLDYTAHYINTIANFVWNTSF